MDTNTYKVGDVFPSPEDVSLCPAIGAVNGVNYGCSREKGHDVLVLGTDHLAAELQPAQRGKPPVFKVVAVWPKAL